MPERSHSERLEILEQKVEGLQEVPARMAAVELQILQLRGDMHLAFSSIDGRFEAIDRRFEAVDRRFDSLAEELRADIRQGDEETRRYMRVLHEEVLERIALIQERPRRPKR